MTAALTVTGARRSFGSTLAVDDVDLTVDDGELVALVGPSGCGKSTLLRIVAGLVAADAGTVQIGDTLVEDGTRRADPEQRDAGLVFQEHALFPHMTVGENLVFGLRSMTRSERNDERDRWLGMIGLPDAGGRYPHELSGGERQRVALARALAPKPRLMLLDEPFASLDPNLRAHLRADVVGLLHDSGTAAVFVTHDQFEAMAVGDRVAVMRAGRFEQLDTPERVFHHPANRFVAAFMGEANFLAVDGRSTELGSITVEGDQSGALAVVRPADLVLHDDEGSAPAGACKARVVATEFRGESRGCTLVTSSGTTLQTVQPHERPVSAGADVWVSLAAHPYALVD